MTADNIILLVIILICAIIFIVIGVCQTKSKEPVGFWTGVKPPAREKVSDINIYNKKHGMMWIIYGAGLITAFFLGMMFGGVVAPYATGIEILGGPALMICYHNYLNKKYVRQQDD